MKNSSSFNYNPHFQNIKHIEKEQLDLLSENNEM